MRYIVRKTHSFKIGVKEYKMTYIKYSSGIEVISVKRKLIWGIYIGINIGYEMVEDIELLLSKIQDTLKEFRTKCV